MYLKALQHSWGALGDGVRGGGGVLSKSKEGVPGDVALGAGSVLLGPPGLQAPLSPREPGPAAPPSPRSQPSGKRRAGTSRPGLARAGL